MRSNLLDNGVLFLCLDFRIDFFLKRLIIQRFEQASSLMVFILKLLILYDDIKAFGHHIDKSIRMIILIYDKTNSPNAQRNKCIEYLISCYFHREQESDH